jgi:hypothetical protein
MFVLLLRVGDAQSKPAALGSQERPAAKSRILVHTLRSLNGSPIVTWRVSGAWIAIAYRGSVDVGLVRGRTLEYWSQGRRINLTRYHFAGLWRDIHLRFGVTQEMVQRSLSSSANTLRLQSPMARRTANAKDNPPVLTTVDDYGENAAALARNAPFPVQYAGASALGYRFARGYIATVMNPRRNGTESGPIATFVYSSNPSRLGAGDLQLTLNLAAQSSHAGQVNAKFIGGDRPSVRANRITGYKANPNQLVFDLGSVIGAITSSARLTDSQWRAILAALRSP